VPYFIIFQKRTNSCLFLQDLTFFGGISTLGEAYSKLNSRFYPYTEFFSQIQIDIPRCFRNSKSLSRNINNFIVLKFINYFMRKGLRIKYLNILCRVHAYIFQNNKNKTSKTLHTNFLHTENLTTITYSLNSFFTQLLKTKPVFSFYIYKVNKNIYKNTRGRLGKYTFI
jgi:hypothetical protein